MMPRYSMLPLLFGIALLVSSAALAQAEHKIYNFNVSWVNNVNPDGRHPRRSIGVNGKFLLPIINVNSTDRVTVKVHNQFKHRRTALHVHGLYFNNTGYYDGAAQIGQCPVPPGDTFEHKVLNAPETPKEAPRQTGTYWAHGHLGGQYVDGYRTPFIIHNAEGEPHKYDDEYTVIVSDWYHREHADLLKNDYLNPKKLDSRDPVPDSPLVWAAHTPCKGEAKYLDGFNNNVSLKFEPGKTYRLRFINMAAFSPFYIWMEGHDMRMIEADGIDMHELPIKEFSISAGQRYSVLVTARNCTERNWQLHTNMDPRMYRKVPKSLQLNVSTTIEYAKHAKVAHDRPTLDKYKVFDDTQLEPIKEMPAHRVDINHDIDVWFARFSDGKQYAVLNNITYRPPLVPTLLTAATTPQELRNKPETYGPNSNAMILPHMKGVQLRIINRELGYHPFHLHGMHFQVVYKDDGRLSKHTQYPRRSTHKRLRNPVRRDTVTVPPMGSAIIRVFTDNPGAWIFHCHNDWHLNAGMALAVVVAPDEIAKRQHIPKFLKKQCRISEGHASGNAAGLNSSKHFGSLSFSAHPHPTEFGHPTTTISSQKHTKTVS